jgi:hypothetical protein
MGVSTRIPDVQEVCTAYQWDDDLTIRMCLELDIRTDRSTKSNVVVDFAVHGEDNLPVFTYERLGSGI